MSRLKLKDVVAATEVYFRNISVDSRSATATACNDNIVLKHSANKLVTKYRHPLQAFMRVLTVASSAITIFLYISCMMTVLNVVIGNT